MPTIPTMTPTTFPTINTTIIRSNLIGYGISRPSRPLNAGARARILLVCFFVELKYFFSREAKT